MDGFGVFLRKELREAARSNRLLIVGVIFLLLGAISPLTAKFTPELLKAVGATQGGVQITFPTPTVKDAVAQFIKNVAGTGIFVAILLPMGLVAREKESGTAAFALTKPLTRPAFLAAKLVALFATLAVGMLAAAVAAYFYTVVFFTALPVGNFLACSALVLLSLLVYASFTFLGSTLANAQLPAAAIGLAVWVVVSLIGILPDAAQYTPAGLLDPAGALALGNDPPHLTVSVLANLAIFAVTVALAWLSFRRQELVPAAA